MRTALFVFLALRAANVAAQDPGPVVDFAKYQKGSGVAIHQDGSRLRVRWPMADGEHGALTLQLQAGQPLIEELGWAKTAAGAATVVLRNVDPVTFVTVGTRDLSKHGWNVFFDNPPQRPHQTFPALLKIASAQVKTHGRHSTVILDGLSAGPFRGDLRFTVYPGCRLVHVEAVVSTDREATAFLYDAGLASPKPSWQNVAWRDTFGQLHRVTTTNQKDAAPMAVRHRTVIAESDGGAVAVFPPPHRYIYPLDFADNFGFVWQGRGFRTKGDDWGLGVRQPPEGDKRWVPWVNAPPGTKQHLGVFYLVSSGKAEKVLEQVRVFTRGDRFKKLEGYRTFTSHYHIEHTLEFVQEQRRQKTEGIPKGLEDPPFARTFRAHGVDIVHLAEFHVRHTDELNAQRLPLLKTMHDECRRLSKENFLVLPGEEPNVHLGGHWVSLFPRPVYWLLHPKAGTPFVQKVEGFGTVYAVHNPQDVLRLMDQEQGLMWTAHPRTKGSYGFPDRYKETDFYRSDRFLGAAWKHMPADYSHPRLGMRALDLFDDMANWGGRKYLVGEVDIFKVLPTHELYGHLNITYVKLDKLPRFDDGWQPVLDALRQGRFFVSTGEILMPEFSVGGKESGQTLKLADTTVDITARLEWTFPPAFAEVIWGDGAKVQRRRVDLADKEAFSSASLRIPVDLRGAKWVRLEAWDIAANGAFSQTVWLE